MKRRLLHLVVALMSFAATTMAQSLSVAPIEATPGTETTITVNIAGATEMTALQCNLQLPEGLTLAGDITLGDAAKGHTLSTSTLASGELLIVLYDLYQSTFTDGPLLTIPVVAAEEPSTTEGTLHKVRTATIAAQSKALSDVKFTAVVETPVVEVAGITLDQTAATLTEGETLTLTATVSPDDATDKTVTWSTSDASVATVANGVVTALAPGTATITAKAGDKEATCVVTVEKKVIAVSGIALDQTAATLTEGETLTLKATVSPDDATDKTVTWSTSDASVATVADGVVTAVAAGTATITAKAGEHSATCVVTVTRKEEPFTGITAISELSNTVLYAVSQPNHSKGATSWAVQEGGQALKSSYDLGLSVDGEDARQQFAFVSNDGGTTLYLYHAAEAKFVAKDGSLGSKPVDAIQFKAGAYDNTFVAYFDDAHYINVGGGSQMIIDSWNIADGGNSCVIVPVGEFDPTEALKAFESEDTGIENPEFNNQKSELIYDLTGRRVEKATKGIYIVNGKKVVIR